MLLFELAVVVVVADAAIVVIIADTFPVATIVIVIAAVAQKQSEYGTCAQTSVNDNKNSH